MSTSNDNLYRFVKATPDNFPKEKGNYFLRHQYEDGRWHGWWYYVVPEAIDKDVWLNLGYEWLEKVEADQQDDWRIVTETIDKWGGVEMVHKPLLPLINELKSKYTLIPKQ